jgi:hypothetical protein
MKKLMIHPIHRYYHILNKYMILITGLEILIFKLIIKEHKYK